MVLQLHRNKWKKSQRYVTSPRTISLNVEGCLSLVTHIVKNMPICIREDLPNKKKLKDIRQVKCDFLGSVRLKSEVNKGIRIAFCLLEKVSRFQYFHPLFRRKENVSKHHYCSVLNPVSFI